MNKRKIANEIFENMPITREQYEVFKGLVDDLGLDTPESEKSWEELFNES